VRVSTVLDEVEATEPAPRPPAELGRGRRALQAGILVVPVAAFLVAGWWRRWIVDDGFIYLRVVRQITSGNGPVFNRGERVETFTSPVWLAILTIADVVTPVRLEWLAVALGIGLSGAGVALAMAGARLLVRRSDQRGLLVPFGAVVFVALIAAWVFASSGLETGVVFGWLGACFYVLARWAGSAGRVPIIAAVILGLGWVVRPELTIFSAVFLLAVVIVQWRNVGLPDAIRTAAAGVALPVAYQVFRMGYYGRFVSNPAVTKESSSADWSRGWDYVVDFVDPYWLWVPAIIVVLGGYVPLISGLWAARASRALLVVGMFVVAGLLDATYIIGVGGDWMHARLLLPALFALVAPVAVIPATRRYLVAVALAPWAFMAMFFFRPPQLAPDYPITKPFVLYNRGFVTTEEWGWGPDAPQRQLLVGKDFYYIGIATGGTQRADLAVKPGVPLPAAAIGAIGVSSYALGPDFYVVDMLGLANTLAAHMISTPSMNYFERKPGHEKPLPTVWFAALVTPDGARPRPADLPVPANPLIPVTSGAEFQEQVAWARATLQCPDISGLLRSTDAPLTPTRFLSNIAHSFERTRLRIPPDPEEAYRKFCGSGTPPEVRAVSR
jgi:arabinofuranosyltransferase